MLRLLQERHFVCYMFSDLLYSCLVIILIRCEAPPQFFTIFLYHIKAKLCIGNWRWAQAAILIYNIIMILVDTLSVQTLSKLHITLLRRRPLVHCVVCPFMLILTLALVHWTPSDACQSLDIVPGEPTQEPWRGSPRAAPSDGSVPSGPMSSTASRNSACQCPIMVSNHGWFLLCDTFAQHIFVIHINVSLWWCKCRRNTRLLVITVYSITSNFMCHKKGTQTGYMQTAVSSVCCWMG